MKIIYLDSFAEELIKILEFISKDSYNKANLFRISLENEIESIIFMPYRNRESIHHDDEDIRDLIFKGYVIVYKIDNSKNSIFVLNIIKNRVN